MPPHPTPPNESRHRSRVVCTRCHARKVKCDLGVRLGRIGSCSNCEKRVEICQRRTKARLENELPEGYATFDMAANTEADVPTPAASWAQADESSLNTEHVEHQSQPETLPSLTIPGTRGYVGDISIVSNCNQLSSASSNGVGSFASLIEEQILSATAVGQPPPQSTKDALIGSYFKYLYHRMPVIDHRDVFSANASPLLVQSVCLAGSILRHYNSSRSLVESEAFYTRAKVLFYTNSEHNSLTVLKALCLLTLWSVTPPLIVVMDCSWNWLGLAIRLATQMGLHQEATYSKGADTGCTRRIAWFLYSQDKLLSTCFGRPQFLKEEDFDLRPPTLADFESENAQSRLFILHTDLTTILGNMVRLRHQNKSTALEDVLSILSKLKEWVLNIPPDFRIFDEEGQRIYHRGFYDIVSWYFTHVITYLHMFGRYFKPSDVYRISLLASSCFVCLLHEMDLRDDTNFLTAISTWAMMVASLPQLNDLSRNNRTTHDNNSVSDPRSSEELNILIDILEQKTTKFPGAKSIVETINRLRSEISSSYFSTPDNTASQPDITTQIPIPDVHELFPFPAALSPRMHLLHKTAAEDIGHQPCEDSNWVVENFFSLEDCMQYSWHNFES